MPAWREGDPVAGRRFADLGAVALELGATLPVRVAYETYGDPVTGPDGEIVNAVLVEHALTGDAHVSGPAGPGQATPGWWDDVVGPARALDTDRWYVVAANVLGGCQGTTGPSSYAPDGRPWGSRFPVVTIRDQVTVEALLADRLGIRRFAAVVGGSMGGMRALEWVVGRPERVGAAVVLAVGAAVTADQLGTQTTQVTAIRSDPAWCGGDYHPGPGPVSGLGVARRIAHLTYRTGAELEERFGRAAQDGEEPFAGGRWAVQSYLDHHADKIASRFDAGSYVTLTEAMNSHDVGRGRGGVPAALAGAVVDGVPVPVVVGGVDSDRLYPLGLQQELADLLPGCEGLDVIVSPYGHDGFLLEADAVAGLVRRGLERSLTTIAV